MSKQEEYEQSQLYRLRNSTAHLMAEAVLEKFPGAKIAIGPAIEDGFYYDFDLPRTLTPEDLTEIEARMKELIREAQAFVRQEITAEQAKELFKDQPYKLELIEGLEQGGLDEDGNPTDERIPITIYTSGHFTDLCRGPHVNSTREINPEAIKLLNVAGAYWRGDEKRPMLQRIYGTAFETKEQLDEYIWKMEEARKRDHRKLGRSWTSTAKMMRLGKG